MHANDVKIVEEAYVHITNTQIVVAKCAAIWKNLWPLIYLLIV